MFTPAQSQYFALAQSQDYILEDEPTTTPTAKTFTQEEVNTFLANNKRDLQKQLSEATATIKALQDQGLTPEARQELEDKLRKQEESFLSEKEKAALERKRAQDEAAKVLKTLADERDGYKKKYYDHLTDTAILSAAADPALKAINPKQLHQMLRHSASIGENDSVLLTVNTKEGKTLTLPVAEALAEFSKDPGNINLFKSDGTSGLHMHKGTPSEGNKDLSSMSFTDYRKNRQEILK